MEPLNHQTIWGKWISSDIVNVVEEIRYNKESRKIIFSDIYTFHPNGRAERIYCSSNGCFEQTFFSYSTKSNILYTKFDDSEEVDEFNIVARNDTLDIMTSARRWIRLKRVNNQSEI